MKKIIYIALIVAVAGLSAFVVADSWKVKTDGMSVKFAGGSIKGSFTDLKADIIFDKDHPEQAKISATVDANSLATGFFIKTSHAKDAIDADDYPTIKFISTSVSKGANGYIANGNLTLKGTTKPIVIHFTFDDKSNLGTFNGNFKIIPKDFNVTRFGTPDEVTITLVVPVTKA